MKTTGPPIDDDLNDVMLGLFLYPSVLLIMNPRYSLLLSAAIAAFSVPCLHAQITARTWVVGGADNNWSSTTNWSGGDVPDTNTESAGPGANGGVTFQVDANFTINNFIDGFAGAGTTTTVGGPGTLTIDRNQTAFANGIDNATGDVGGLLLFTGNVRIANSASTGTNAVTGIRNANSAGNVTRFDTTSSLTLNSILQTVTSVGGRIEFNGTFAPSTADMQINSNNVFFGTGHDSSNYGRDFVFFVNGKLVVEAGTVLNEGRKFQVNGNNAILQLDGADVINRANINVGGTNNFRIDVNANQTKMGGLTDVGGALTINVGPSVTSLWFLDSALSAEFWGTGTLTINGFRENTIRFGTDANGLTTAQLAAINEGAYFLKSNGYLTTGAVSSAIETWRESFFDTAANDGTAADTADFDGDGLSNLLEYATGSDPTIAASSNVVIARSGSFLTLTFNRINDPLLTYTIEESADLATGFTPTGTTYTGTANDTVLYTDDVSLATPSVRQFLRLKVTYGYQP